MSRQDAPPPTQDIVHIKPRLGALAHAGPPLAGQPWFLAIQGVPVLLWLSALVWRRRTEALANNPRLRRSGELAQGDPRGPGQLRRQAAEKRFEDFFATLFRLLQEQLGERLDLPASAITEAVIEEHLRPRSVPDKVLAPLQELFQTCNLARYAPVSDCQELAAVIPNWRPSWRSCKGCAYELPELQSAQPVSRNAVKTPSRPARFRSAVVRRSGRSRQRAWGRSLLLLLAVLVLAGRTPRPPPPRLNRRTNSTKRASSSKRRPRMRSCSKRAPRQPCISTWATPGSRRISSAARWRPTAKRAG